MDPIVLLSLRGLVLVLLYLFVARAVRAVLRDLRSAPASAPAAPKAADPAGKGKRRAKERPPPRELVVHQPGGRPRVLTLGGSDEVTFGRAETSTVILSDQYVSERHARVYRDGGEWLVADAGSTNGTLLNKAKVSRPTPIAPGDQLDIGRVSVEVRK